MVTVTRTDDYLAHKGTKGMKWGYNDGKRNGKRTASELKKLQKVREKLAKENKEYSNISDNVEKDYVEANNMLKYLGISLDLHSDDSAVAKTMAIYNQMKDIKDEYDNQYDWLKTFSNKLAGIGYDMKGINAYLDANEEELKGIEKGSGSGNTEGYEKPESTKSSGGSKKSSGDKSSNSDSSESTKTDEDDFYEELLKDPNFKLPAILAEKKKKKKKNKNKKKEPEYSIQPVKDKDPIYTIQPVKDKGQPAFIYDNEGTKKKSNSAKMSDHSQNGSELYHHGILGQKWGVRRYQNADGSLTSEGRKHYNQAANNRNSKVSELSGHSNNSSDGNSLNKTVHTTVNSARKVNHALDKAENAKYRKKISKMTNEELEKEISKALPEYEARVIRQQLEQKYQKVVGNPNSTKSGRDKAMEAIEIIGGAAIASKAVIDLAVAIKKVM